VSTVSSLLGRDKRKRKGQKNDPYDANRNFGGATLEQGSYGTPDRNRFLALLDGGQEALNTSVRAGVSAAMPSLKGDLQSSKEDAIRRGISTGDLGTSYEGDIWSAFDKHLTDSVAGQAMNLYGTQLGASQNLYENDTNRYLDMLSGTLDRKQGARNAKRQGENSLATGFMQMIGDIAGGRSGGKK
jgi:hypothetical protein